MTCRRRSLAILALALSWAACDFQPDPDPGPTAVGPARFVSVTIQYRQPTNCINASASGCDNAVVFLGSWMRAGQEVYLNSDPGSRVWTGVANGVPVNWPPVEEPHLVRVFDPYLYDTPTAGVTAARLVLGGQMLDTYEQPGTPQESALVYVDDNGVGRNPF
jgi:hypothetical protein